MKYSTVVAATLVSVVAAQDLSQLPQCAQSAAITGITSTGCQLTDIACICKSTSFLQSVAASIQTTCTAEEQQKTYAFAANLCSQAGVTISTPSAGGASTSAPASSAAETSAAETSSAVETSSAAVESSSAAETTTAAATESATSVAVTESATAIPTATEVSTPTTYAAGGNGTLPTVVPVPVPSSNATATGGSGSGSTSSVVPSPTFVSGAVAQAGSIVLSVVMAAVAVFAL